MQRCPSGSLKVNKIAGKPSSGSKIASESRLAREFEKNDITDPTVRQDYAGCAKLLTNSASKIDVSSGKIFAMVSVASRDAVLLKDMLMMSAPASIAMRTACMKLRRSRLISKSCTFSGQAAFVPTGFQSTAIPSEDAVLARIASRSSGNISDCGRFMVCTNQTKIASRGWVVYLHTTYDRS